MEYDRIMFTKKKKEWTIDTFNYMDESQNSLADLKKNPENKEYIVCDFIYRKF